MLLLLCSQLECSLPLESEFDQWNDETNRILYWESQIKIEAVGQIKVVASSISHSHTHKHNKAHLAV